MYSIKMYSIKLLITPYNLSSHAHVCFTNHYFERINPSQGIFMKRVKTYPYRKQKFDEQKVERGRNKRLSGCETSGRYPQVATTRQISKRGVTRVRAMFARPV